MWPNRTVYVDLTCLRCGKEYTLPPWRAKTRVGYCSRACQYTPSVELTCLGCGSPFLVSPYLAFRKFCKAACRKGYHGPGYIPIEKRFWKRVAKEDFERVEGLGPCWVWTGPIIASNGYGNILYGDKTTSAHRVAWMLENGDIPDGLFVLHKCDVRPCVRNDGENSHLFLGTHADNMRDAARKGRLVRPKTFVPGEDHVMAKLNPSSVREIRHLGSVGKLTQSQIGVQFGISQGHVSLILAGKSWGDVI